MALIGMAATFSRSLAEPPKPNAIKFLVEDLSKNYMWPNGIFVPLTLPESATFEQLVAAYLEIIDFEFGRIVDYDIEEAQNCVIPPETLPVYKIVRISSEQGGKFLIFRYQHGAWWTKSFDAKEQFLKAIAEQETLVR